MSFKPILLLWFRLNIIKNKRNVRVYWTFAVHVAWLENRFPRVDIYKRLPDLFFSYFLLLDYLLIEKYVCLYVFIMWHAPASVHCVRHIMVLMESESVRIWSNEFKSFCVEAILPALIYGGGHNEPWLYINRQTIAH